MQRTGEQLRQLLGQQLSRAVVPLATAPLATLNRRRPALVAPSSPAAAAARFADYDDAPVAAPAPLDYNPYRDNFSDMNPDGSYIFGYSLPNGVRRWERGYFSGQQQSRVVEGFSVEPRHYQSGVSYELRCYRADAYGYHPLGIEYIQQPPVVRRDLLPRVHCLNLQR
ncbi:uncharacterized protein LOC108604940 [Drosophila busckii]|uniref:uncharacterized protein LOC108604940 n=1 Tax=Drosophila busckii TaxID=30019 RepID=UPI00083F4BF7|nr:uncharacterized protein LOC108604940 [Drosophila busckii]